MSGRDATSIKNAAQSPERIQRARELFETVCAEPSQARAAILLRECEGDTEMRAMLERMISADAKCQLLLDSSLREFADAAASLPAGTRIGKYRIIRGISTGGMGAVYLAELAEESRSDDFAIKIVRWHAPDLARRLERERAILSTLRHPNIACFVDGGATPEGVPYFVMEYVDGAPIHRHADERKLAVAARLELFRQVCAAVAYLHQNFVVHRDLKPGNILTTADGTIKVVDFGISRMIEEATGMEPAMKTFSGLMTPDYASPEQVRGRPTTALTDVYSLGALLYELLTGLRPFAASGVDMHELLRRVCEDEPKKPSLACRMDFAAELRGELDNIMLKALRKEPERRYSSVEKFDEDVRRYLAGLPVMAQGDSVVYRVSKFVRRNRLSVLLSIAILAALIVGLVATGREARIARREQTKAEMQARRAEEASSAAAQQGERAERNAAEADRERANAEREREKAERRLAALTRIARGAAGVFASSTGRSGTPDAAARIAENARDSLAALKSEGIHVPEFHLLDKAAAEARSFALAEDPSWHVPSGWKATQSKMGEYRVGLDRQIAYEGKSSLFIRSLIPSPEGFVWIYQTFQAAAYRGKRMLVQGFSRELRVERSAVLFISIMDQRDHVIASDRAEAPHGDGWRQLRVVIDMPAESESIQLGIAMSGPGTLWADGFRVESVPHSVPLTRRSQPFNLTFTTTH